MYKRIKALVKNEPLVKKMIIHNKKQNPLQKGIAYVYLILSLVCAETSIGLWNNATVYAAELNNSSAKVIVFPTASSSLVHVSDIEDTLVLDNDNDPSLSVNLVENEEKHELLQNVVVESNENVIQKTSHDNYYEEQATVNKIQALSQLNQAISEGAKKSYEAKEAAKKEAARKEAARKEAEKKAAAEAAAKRAALKASTYVNNPKFVVKLTEAEYDLLCRLVYCEAGAEDEIGKILVTNVVLNRVNSPSFPNSITAVINSPRQFQPVSTGWINRVKPSKEVIAAVDKALSGVDYSKGALYFINPKYCSSRWFDNNLTKIIVHRDSVFYK